MILDFKKPIEGSESKIFKEGIIEPSFFDNKVRFSFKFCESSRKFCIKNLINRDEIKRFYKTLAYFEDMTWQQLQQLRREDGISQEKKDTNTYKILKDMCPTSNRFGHFRVDGMGTPFRVFVGFFKDLSYIILIDRNGRVQSH